MRINFFLWGSILLGAGACAQAPAANTPTTTTTATTATTTGTTASRLQPGAASRFERARRDAITPRYVPQALSPRPVSVIVQLQSEPVARVQAAAGRRLLPHEAESIAATLRREQSPVRQAAAALGGKLLGEYQHAFNGLKLSIDRKKVAELRRLPGVVSVHPVRIHQRRLINSVPLIGAPTVWAGVPGINGAGTKIGIIDTGLDYTHADFGGPGTQEAIEAAFENNTTAPNPALFDAEKFGGGYDLAGDAYDANDATSVPVPDVNPLDCNSHGTHVAGIAAGYGVRADGKTYRGPYDASTYAASFQVGPGVAPKARLYSYRVFGCEGSTSLVIDAVNRAVADGMDVISLSLGSPFGEKDDADARALDNAAAAGAVVVVAAGNEGPQPYMLGSPGSSTRAITVAASDARLRPAAVIGLPGGVNIVAINANGASLPSGNLAVKVLRSPGGEVALGCDFAEYAGSAGKLVVTVRGVCARVDRAIFAQAAGAAGVVMINNASDYPPFEGAINGPTPVTIPFLGVRGLPSGDGGAVVRANGAMATLAAASPLPPAIAGFSSGGPRSGDSGQKPDVTAPGVAITSAYFASGTGGAAFSGTSMATPHIAGVAALLRQALPRASVDELKARIVNTASPQKLFGYTTRIGGGGLVNVPAALKTAVYALGDEHTGSLSFGYQELSNTRSFRKRVTLRNTGDRKAIFNVTIDSGGGVAHGASADGAVRVNARETAEIELRITVDPAVIGDSGALRQASGLVTFTPADASQNGGVALHVPYSGVFKALSKVSAGLRSCLTPQRPVGQISLANRGAIASAADFYTWGLSDPRDVPTSPADVRAVGVQSFPNPWFEGSDNQLLVFAVHTWQRWSNASTNELDLSIDVDGDGRPDYLVVGIDNGLITSGDADGRMLVLVVSLHTGVFQPTYFAVAPTDGTVALLPLNTSDLCMDRTPCLSAANPRFTYSSQAFDLLSGAADDVNGTAGYNPWAPALSNGDYVPLDAGARGTSAVAVNAAEWAHTPALGVMVVSPDNHSDSREAALLSVPFKASSECEDQEGGDSDND